MPETLQVSWGLYVPQLGPRRDVKTNSMVRERHVKEEPLLTSPLCRSTHPIHSFNQPEKLSCLENSNPNQEMETLLTRLGCKGPVQGAERGQRRKED